MKVTDPRDFRAPLLYSATTESSIPWDWISRSRGSAFMPESERAETLLRAVNGDKLTVKHWHRLCGAPLRAAIATQGAAWEGQRVPLIQEARVALQAALEAALRDPESAIPQIDKNALAITDSRVLRVMELSDHGVPRDRVIAENIGAALVDALTVVLNPSKPYRRRLRQCAYAECGEFGFGPVPAKAGQPPTYHCSPEHRVLHRKEQNREKVAAHRANKSVDEYRREKAEQQRNATGSRR